MQWYDSANHGCLVIFRLLVVYAYFVFQAFPDIANRTKYIIDAKLEKA